MSGIAGAIRLDGGPVARAEIQGMACALSRRGPDREGVWCAANAALAQTLLATTPEALAESQPWSDPASGCVVVSDSRLDNRAELLRELGLSRATPDDIGDAELLHTAWQRWGARCAERLLGDFAFAIWDSRNRRMFCARDAMGVRPLCYHMAPGRLFAFASEARALLTLPQVPRRIDEGRIADALVGELEGLDRISTFYRAIVRLPPAHVLLIDEGRLRVHEYWHPLMHRPPGLPRSEGEWIEAEREQLRQAVHCRLRASGQVGSMLSGGLDSSSVVAAASRLLRARGQPPLATFSSVNGRGECPETRAIGSMLRALSLDATTIDVQSMDAVAPLLRDSLDHLGEPFDGSMLLIAAQYCLAASRGVRSLLDGVPADNLFTTNGHVRQLARSGSWLRAYRYSLGEHRAAGNRLTELRALKSVAGALAPTPVRWARQWQQDRTFVAATLMRDSLIDPEFAQRVRLGERYRRYRTDMDTTNVWDSSGEGLSSMTAAYITAAIERYGRVAASFGVEPRHPYLDRRLVEFHAWLPIELRNRDGHSKWVLRKAMQDVLPADVAWRTDKEHLGYLVNMVVVGDRVADAIRTAEANGGQNAYVDARKLSAALTAWRDRRDEQAFEALYPVFLVEQWLRSSLDSVEAR